MDPIVRAAKIKEALLLRGLTFADIDRDYGLISGSARATLREPNEKGEAALCDALALEPHKVWPERYDSGGHRLKPQPLQNRIERLVQRQRRNDRAA